MREFARFFVGGLTGASANLMAVWLVRGAASYKAALLAGLAAGFVVSFLMSKLFAFRSRGMARTGAEALRFVIVYVVGMLLYFAVSLALGRGLLPHLLPARAAELAGAMGGSASMMLTSYFGHRFFTYAHVTGADLRRFRRPG